VTKTAVGTPHVMLQSK